MHHITACTLAAVFRPQTVNIKTPSPSTPTAPTLPKNPTPATPLRRQPEPSARKKVFLLLFLQKKKILSFVLFLKKKNQKDFYSIAVAAEKFTFSLRGCGTTG
jgi:hypothetical protein